MPASQDPNSSLYYGWSLGEGGWNLQMDSNLLRIGATLQISVKDKDLTEPPSSPADGDRYLVGASATGAWAGNDGKLAVYRAASTSWGFYSPAVGWICYVADEDVLYYYKDDGWTSLGSHTFIDLADTPASYTGQAGKIAIVNENEDALEFVPIGSGTGDISGPASSTDNTVPRFNGVSGKIVQGSSVVIDDDNNLSGHGSKIITDATTARTLTAADRGAVIAFTSADPITVTLPETSTEAIPAGFQCALVQRGAGQVTVAVQGTDTLESKGGSTKLSGQHSIATVVKLVAGTPNVFGLYGDITP